MQVQKAYYAVVIFLTYWVRESGEGFFWVVVFLLWFFFFLFSLMELFSTDYLGVL